MSTLDGVSVPGPAGVHSPEGGSFGPQPETKNLEPRPASQEKALESVHPGTSIPHPLHHVQGPGHLIPEPLMPMCTLTLVPCSVSLDLDTWLEPGSSQQAPGALVPK